MISVSARCIFRNRRSSCNLVRHSNICSSRNGAVCYSLPGCQRRGFANGIKTLSSVFGLIRGRGSVGAQTDVRAARHGISLQKMRTGYGGISYQTSRSFVSLGGKMKLKEHQVVIHPGDPLLRKLVDGRVSLAKNWDPSLGCSHAAWLPSCFKVLAVGDTYEEIVSSAGGEDKLATADVILYCSPHGKVMEQLLPAMPRLVWAHAARAGVEGISPPWVYHAETHPRKGRSPVLTNSKGIFSLSLAEYAVHAALYHLKGTPAVLAAQRQGVWQKVPMRMAAQATVGIIGLGDIGREVARLAKAMGMRTIGVRRRATEDPRFDVESAVLSEPSRDNSQIQWLMQESDIVVAALPSTSATKHLINDEVLGAAKPGSLFVNLGRGITVDQAALVARLRHAASLQEQGLPSDGLAAAVLDVFAEEPVLENDPIWSLPENVLLASAHTADHVVDSDYTSLDHALDLFAEQAFAFSRRGLSGLKNLVDPRQGY